MATTAEELFATLDQPTEPSPVDDLFTSIDQPQEPDFMDRMGAIGGKRRGEVEKTWEDYQGGLINTGELVLQAVGKGFFGTLNDVIGETVKTGAHEAVSAILSEKSADQAEAWLSEQIASGVETVMSVDEARQMLDWYQSLDPNDRKNLDSFANIVTGITPAATGKASLKGALKGGGKMLKGHAAAGRIKRDKKKLSGTALDQSAAAKRGRAQNNPNQLNLDNDILDTLLTVKGVKPGAKPDVNKRAVEVELDKLEDQIFKELGEVRVMIPKNVVNSSVNKKISNIISETPSLDLSRPFNRRLKKELDTILNLEMRKFDGSAQGLRELRQAFDRAIEREAGNARSVFSGQSRKSPMVKAYRDGINDLMDNIVAQKGIDVKSLRRRQHKLILARDNFGAMEGKVKSKMDKAKQFLQSHPYLTAGLLSSSSILAKPAAVAAGAIGLPAYGAYKTATSPALRQGIGEVMQGVGTVGPTATRGMFYGAPEEQQ
jgi:hypothetical protein